MASSSAPWSCREVNVGAKIGSLVLGWVVKIIAGLIERYTVAWQRRSFARSAAVRDTLEIHRARVGATRAILLQTHNGGGRLTGNALLKSSVVLEAYASVEDSLHHAWQSQPVDAEYRGLLHSLLEHQVVLIEPSTMAPGLLRGLYQAKGVQMSGVALVRSRSDAIDYVSINVTTLPEHPCEICELRDQLREAARSCASEIRALMGSW